MKRSRRDRAAMAQLDLIQLVSWAAAVTVNGPHGLASDPLLGLAGSAVLTRTVEVLRRLPPSARRGLAVEQRERLASWRDAGRRPRTSSSRLCDFDDLAVHLPAIVAAVVHRSGSGHRS